MFSITVIKIIILIIVEGLSWEGGETSSRVRVSWPISFFFFGLKLPFHRQILESSPPPLQRSNCPCSGRDPAAGTASVKYAETLRTAANDTREPLWGVHVHMHARAPCCGLAALICCQTCEETVRRDTGPTVCVCACARTYAGSHNEQLGLGGCGEDGRGGMTSTESGMCLNWHLPHGTKSCEETGNASHVLERAHVRACVRASSPAQPSSVLYCLHQTEKLF